MANNDKLIIEERSRRIGNFMVGRLLPFRKKRQVGPFTFVDHMGPSIVKSPNWIDIDQHPHIGLCTFTYLLEGAIEHKDSTGACQIIRPGDVGLMTSGKGVTHTERTPASLRTDKVVKMHGYQIWIALPIEKEEINPRFDFLKKEDVPTWKCEDMEMKLLAGEAYGKKSPLPVHSPLFVLDIIAKEDTTLDLKGHLTGEIALLINRGKIINDGRVIEEGQLMVSRTENECQIKLEKDTRIIVFGGPKLEQERFLYWNFVSSSKERIEQAKQDWIGKQFPKVEGDDTYIPMPK